jgi:WD40 repeat protein
LIVSRLLSSLASVFLLLAAVALAPAQRPEVYVQQGPDAVSCIAISPDGRLFAAGADVIRFYDLKDRRELRTVRHSELRALAFSPDGKFLASAGKDDKPTMVHGLAGDYPATVYSVRLWNVATGILVRTIGTNDTQFHDIAFMPDGQTVAASSGNPLKLFDVAGKAEPRGVSGKSTALRLAISPDGRTLAGETYEHTIRLWDISTGAEKISFPGHKESIYTLRFSQDGKLLASGSHDETIILWNVDTGKSVHTFKDTNSVRDVYFAKDGQTLLSVSGDFIRRWNIGSGKRDDLLKQPNFASDGGAFSPDGTTAITATYQKITVSDINTAQSVYVFPKRGSNVCALWMLDRDQAHGLIAEDSISSNLWDYDAGEYRGQLEHSIFCNGLNGLVSPDLKLVAMPDQNGVALFDANTRALVRRIETGQNYLGTTNFSFSADSRLLAVGGIDGVTKVLDVTSAKVISTIVHNPPPKKIEVAPGLSVSDPAGMFPRIAMRTAFSTDGKTLAVSVPNENFSPVVIFWDVATGRELRRFTGHDEHVMALAFSADGERLASGDHSGVIKVWEAKTGKELFTLPGHKGAVGALLFAPHNLLISGANDGQIKLWDLSNGHELVSLVSINGTDWLAVTPDGLFDGSSRAWSEVLWRFSPELRDIAPVEIFFNEYFYPNLLPDILAGKRPVAEAEIRTRDRRQPFVKVASEPVDSTTADTRRTTRVKIDVSEAPKDNSHSSGSGVRDVRLFRNGSLVKVWRGDAALRNGKATFEAPVPLVAGENHFTAYAFNDDNIKSGNAELNVSAAPTPNRSGVVYVLAVGVNEYSNVQYNLKYAVADAKAFGAEFEAQQKRLSRFERIEVAYLTDRDATRINILQQLETLAKKVQPEDVVMIYFAGHGTAQQNRFFLIPHDLGYAGPRDQLDGAGLQTILTHSISDEDIERAVEGIDAAQIVLLIDACNSGQALESEEKRRGPMNSRGLAQLAYEKGMYILTAAQSYQSAIETQERGHGYLTYALVEEGLKTGSADVHPRDGEVSLREWLDYATLRVPELQRADTKSGVDALRQLEREKPPVPSTTPAKSEDSLQQPRVFYRREIEPRPLVVARP